MKEELLYYEPRKQVVDLLGLGDGEPEMTEIESAFVCGLIKDKKPKKILEVGVAGGGTTAIILQCLKSLGYTDTVVYSVDLNEKFYRDNKKKTGYIAEDLKQKIDTNKHITYYGNILPEVINKIGDDIDFFILDTVHFMPGELLDFPVALPFLQNDAVFVLHDIHFHNYFLKNGISNGVLFSVINGEKHYLLNKEEHVFTNIGGMNISDETRNGIKNVFLALGLPWDYTPDEKQLNLYRDFYKEYYSDDILELYEASINLHHYSKEKLKLSLYRRLRRCVGMLLYGR